MPFIRAAEGMYKVGKISKSPVANPVDKLKLAFNKLSMAEKSNEIRLMVKLLDIVLPDILDTHPEEATQIISAIDSLHASTTNNIIRYAPMFKQHISATKDQLVSAQAFQDTLGPGLAKIMKHVIDALEEKVALAEALRKLIGEECVTGAL